METILEFFSVISEVPFLANISKRVREWDLWGVVERDRRKKRVWGCNVTFCNSVIATSHIEFYWMVFVWICSGIQERGHHRLTRQALQKISLVCLLNWLDVSSCLLTFKPSEALLVGLTSKRGKYIFVRI